MPTTTRTVFLTDENGNPLIDAQRNMRTLSFSLVQGFSYRLVERASIVSATYAQVVGYSTATGQTITGVENASKFDVGDFGIVQYAISDRNNTIGYVTCEVTAVGTDSLTVNGIGISVAGADGKDGKDGAPGADGKDGAATIQIGTVTTGTAGSQASITNVGTANAAILNFTIPRGNTGAQGNPGADGAPGEDGQDGTTFTPSVDTNGDLSWTNDGGLPNPETVNIKGADGASGVTDVTAGAPTEQDGYTVTPVTFNFEQGNSKTVNIQAKNGEGMLQSQTFTIAGGDENAVLNFSTAFINFASTHNIVAAHIVQTSGLKLDFVLNGKNYSLNYPTFEYSSIGEAFFSGWVIDEDAPAEMFRGQIICLGDFIMGFVGQGDAVNPEVTNISTQRGLSVIAYYQ